MNNSSEESCCNDSLNKLRQFRLQKKMPSASCFGNISESGIMKNENQIQFVSAGKDQGVYLTPDFPEGVTEVNETSNENIEEVDIKPNCATGSPESFLQVIYNDGESINNKSNETEDTSFKHSNQIKDKLDESQSVLPVPLDKIKVEIDFEENRTEKIKEPISSQDIKKELDIEIEVNIKNDDNADDNACMDDNDDDNNNSNDGNNNKNNSNQSLKRKHENTYCDLLKERERSLKQLMEKFPYADIMEMQDILLFAEWNIGQAIAFVEEHPNPFIISRRKLYHPDLLRYKKLRSGSEFMDQSEEDLNELTSNGWLARANKDTLKTYSKNISETKIVHPNIKPFVYYGSKERARTKMEVEKFISEQFNKTKLSDGILQEKNHAIDPLKENIDNSNSVNEVYIKVENEDLLNEYFKIENQ